jgi:uroporphyrinogen-III synthase
MGLMANLSGLQIVITRPREQAEPWAKTLSELGASVSKIALMDIIPIEEPSQIQTIKNQILNLDHYQKVIFVSQNAVKYGLEWINNYWPQMPSSIHFFAIGETTANQLQTQGIAVTDLAQTQTGPMNSESLLESAALKNIADQRILILRGLGGRSHLAEVLETRGAKVDYCELYTRQLPTAAAQHFMQLMDNVPMHNAMPAIIVTLHSGEALTNLVSVSNHLPTQQQKLLRELVLLVPSNRVALNAANKGFNNVYTAENATDTCMLEQLDTIKRNLFF